MPKAKGFPEQKIKASVYFIKYLKRKRLSCNQIQLSLFRLAFRLLLFHNFCCNNICATGYGKHIHTF